MKTQNLKIQIPEPCHEDWNKMTLKDKGAFCGSCEKVVVDFTKMSDRQIVDFLNKNKGKKTCGKFNTYQVDRKISVTTPPPNYYWRIKQFFVGLFVSLSFPGFTKSIDAPISFKPLPTLDDADLKKASVKGVVKDTEGSFIPSAYVRIYINGRITKDYAITDETGSFTLSLPDNYQKKTLELRVTAQNYETQSLLLDSETTLEIVMEFSQMELLGELVSIPIEEPQEMIGQTVISELKEPCTLPPEVEEGLEVPEISKLEITGEPVEVIMGDVAIAHPDNYLPQQVTGSVVDGNGEPLAFVNVLIENTQIGTTTDFDGNFKLELPLEIQKQTSATLKISYLGYESQTVILNPKDATGNVIMLKVVMSQPFLDIMGVMIAVPIEDHQRPSNFDDSYQEPAWKEAGFDTRREYKEFLKNNQ